MLISKMNVDRTKITRVLKAANYALTYPKIAKGAGLLNEVTLHHLDELEDRGVVTSYFDNSLIVDGRLERCFQLVKGKTTD